MALNNQEFDAVCDAVRDMLIDHVKNPFDLIREQSVVSEVYCRLRSNTDLFKKKAPLTLWPIKPPGINKVYQWRNPVLNVNRVQCEMRIKEFNPSRDKKKNETEQSSKAIKKDKSGERFGRVDLVVLREDKVCLEVEKNGPGDVLNSVSVDYIDAAIEFKSCPLKNQKDEVCNDLQDLYQAQLIPNPRQPLDCFLVFLDKTQDLYGNVVPSTGWWRYRNRDWPITQLQQDLRGRLRANVNFTPPPTPTIYPAPWINSTARQKYSAAPRVWIFVVEGQGFKEYVLA